VFLQSQRQSRRWNTLSALSYPERGIFNIKIWRDIMAGKAMSKAVISDPDVQTDAPEIEENAISARAYELWQERGCPDGSDREDWIRAEQELKERRAQSPKAA
jgi:hypothetical protein